MGDYVSLSNAWKRFCDLRATGEPSLSRLKESFKIEIVVPLKAKTFERVNFIDVRPIARKVWDNFFGGECPHIYLLAQPDNVPLGDFYRRSDFAEYVQCAGYHFRFSDSILFDKPAFESLPVWLAGKPDLVEVAKGLFADGERNGKQAWKKAQAAGIDCTREKFNEAWKSTPGAGRQGPKGPRKVVPGSRDNSGKMDI